MTVRNLIIWLPNPNICQLCHVWKCDYLSSVKKCSSPLQTAFAWDGFHQSHLSSLQLVRSLHQFGAWCLNLRFCCRSCFACSCAVLGIICAPHHFSFLPIRGCVCARLAAVRSALAGVDWSRSGVDWSRSKTRLKQSWVADNTLRHRKLSSPVSN